MAKVRVLFVCTENTCRSPMAQVIFQNICRRNGDRRFVVRGAGIHAREGTQMMEDARRALRICGEKLTRGAMVSSQFKDCMHDEFDFIIGLTRGHANYIRERRWSERAGMRGSARGCEMMSESGRESERGGKRERARVYCLDDLVRCGDISDPFMLGGDVYVFICRQLQSALELLYRKISEVIK